MKYYEDDIAVVSYSSVFPGCDDENILFEKLLQGECLVKDLTADEEQSSVQLTPFYSANKKDPDTTYNKHASRFAYEEINRWAERNKLNTSKYTTTEIILHELFARMQKRQPELFKNKKSECIFAMSTGEPDPIRISQRKVYRSIKKKMDLTESEKQRIEKFLKISENNPSCDEHLPKHSFSTLIFESIRDRFAISGGCSFIDAACASSLAAFMIAVRRLQDQSSDVVFTGAVESGVNMLTLLSFGKLQILSEKVMNPFDKSADGINQGEGAAIFALMRLKDAKEQGFSIEGVIRNCDGSSDGGLGGMVEPTEYGQTLAYERAYQGVPLYPVTYLECHGTGTKLGDKTELSSTAKFFHPLPPIGSVKANLGHTIAAAGAASLVKALKVIETKTVPKMPNFRKKARQWPHTIYKENHKFEGDDTVRIGISSFGFGGANFHLVVDEYKNEELHRSSRSTRDDFKYVLNGSAEVDLKYIYELFSASRHKIPPVSLPYADPAVIGGVLAVDKLFSSGNLRLSQKQKEKIGVISNSNSYLQRLIECFERICHLEVFRRLEDPAKMAKYIAENMPNDLTVTEDTFMWALNNLIAGRSTKNFDLKGPSFNVAHEKASLGLTLSYVRSLLKNNSGAYVIINLEESLRPGEFYVDRSVVRAYLVSDLEYSLATNLPIDREITNIKATRQGAENAYA